MTMQTVVFGLGANLGDAAAALRGAVARLQDSADVQVVSVSSLYRTAPVGGPEQPEYCNAVVVAHSDSGPQRLLALAHEIEQAYGRTREVRWGPRTLDVDLLAVDRLVRQDPALTLPHPRAHVRAFVLLPWAEIDPGFEIEGRGRVGALADALPDSDRAGVARVDDDAWSEEMEALP